MGKRIYRQSTRAEQQRETRQRIIEAAASLHEEVGPAETTIAAIAERAGVQRLTVYRHFPEERELLGACASHWATSHPAPTPVEWSGIDDPTHRIRAALASLYRYYEEVELMLSSLYRDAERLPLLAELMRPFGAYIDGLRDGLLSGWNVRADEVPALRAAIGHALRFQTWRTLVRTEELESEAAAEVMATMVAGLRR